MQLRALVYFLVIFLLSLTLPSISHAQLQVGAVTFPTKANNANAMYPVDLDGDGDIDLVKCGERNVSWFENQGDWENIVEHSIAINKRSFEAGIADMDGDGDLDIVVGDIVEDEILLLKNDGNENFASTVMLSDQVDSPRSITVDDLDGDGDVDIVFCSFSDDYVGFIENLDNLDFAAAASLGANYIEPIFVNLADVDGDTDPDLLITLIDDGSFVWMENQGALNFGTAQIIADQLTSPLMIVPADVDNDGDLDLVSATRDDELIAWHENDGTGVFSDPVEIAITSTITTSVHVDDFNNDGIPDVIATAATNQYLAWYEGDGSGGFTSHILHEVEATAGSDFAFSADLNGDSYPDLIWKAEDYATISEFISVRFNDGTGSFGDETIVASGRNDGPTDIEAADIDGDGDIDFALASLIDGEVSWYANNGFGAFSAQHILAKDVDQSYMVHIVDFDEDGDNDIFSSIGLNVLAWHENTGGGVFATAQELSYTTNASWREVAVVDFDSDNDLDVFMKQGGQGSAFIWRENLGDETFDTFNASGDLPTGIENIELMDIDGDGIKDLLGQISNVLGWYESTGNGEVLDFQSFDQESQYRAYGADMDGDGLKDIVLLQNNSEVAWMKNMGTSDFVHQQTIETTLSSLDEMEINDFDGDGDLDVLCLRNGTVSILENQGDGTLNEALVLLTSGGDSEYFEVADFDGDGDSDIILSSPTEDLVRLYANTTGEGCMDPTACNYNPSADTDDGTCAYTSGCTNPDASNYNPSVICDDGTCGFVIQGHVFFDENEDGIWDEEENGIEGVTVQADPGGFIGISNATGAFTIDDVPAGSVELSVNNPEQFPNTISTEPLNVELTSENLQGLQFGISNELQIYDIYVGGWIIADGFDCDVSKPYAVIFRNDGNVTVDVVIEVTYDALYQGHEESFFSSIDSSNANRIYLSYQGLIPGETRAEQYRLIHPTVANIDDSVTVTNRVWGYNGLDSVAYGEGTRIYEVTCAYDPNDKQVFPSGYTEEHYIAEESDLEYLVRFQNTGNATATNVHIQDTLDVNLDLNSFEVLGHSHAVQTSINPLTREIDFYFEDIFLPDSTQDLLGSQGYISYAVKVNSGVPLLTTLNNTAYIFFDNNPPVVTNTTWSTIYNCSLFEVNFIDDSAPVLIASEADTYQWYLDGAPIAGATDQQYGATENGGAYSVEMTNGFPCTGLSDEISVIWTGLEEIESLSVKLFPNPLTGTAVIGVENFYGPMEVSIYDAQGKLLKASHESAPSQLTISRNGLSSGRYLLVIQAGSERKEIPFVID